jgi:hypothetical protein
VRVGFRALDTSRDWDYVKRLVPIALTEYTSGIVAVDLEAMEPVAAMVCETWTPLSVQCHFMVTNRAAFRAKFQNECARYVFTLGMREKMIGIVPSSNDAALKLNKHFGFTEVARIKDTYTHGEDAVIMEMHRDDCKYWDGFEAEELRRSA